jgi:hypothetical protein
MPYQASISVPMAVPPPSRSMAVFVWMLMMRYVPGAVLKGAIVEADAASNTVDDVDTAADEVDDGGEEDVEVVEVVVGYGPWVVVCCCCGVSMVELESELELELELELRLKLKLAVAGRSAAETAMSYETPVHHLTLHPMQLLLPATEVQKQSRIYALVVHICEAVVAFGAVE